MFAFGIRYLNGFVAASEPDARERVEWPPHPGRVFMALAAAHFQTGADPAERQALLWLEGLREAPAIRAPEASRRAVVTTYVPVNDRAGDKSRPPKAQLQSAPLARDRQARTFARAWLEADTVYLVWPGGEPPAEVRTALEGLCGKVTRLGHSSSLVQMWLASDGEVGDPTWVPDDARAMMHLRVAGTGTLEHLERRYGQARLEEYAELQLAAEEEGIGSAGTAARRRLRQVFPDGAPTPLRPTLSEYQGYARPAPEEPQAAPSCTVFSQHPIVLTLDREDGPYRHLDLLCVLAVARRWREALVSQSNDLPERVRQVVSGHARDGAPLQEAHLAFLPLAFVGHRHADGRLLGMGLALPASIALDGRRGVMRALARVRTLALGRLGSWRVEGVGAANPPWNLRPDVWTGANRGATSWSTVTPIAFDRHPRSRDRASYGQEVEEMIAESCRRIGLPEPYVVRVTPISGHLGVPPSHAFPRLLRKDGSQRRHTHAIVAFDRPVRGPILLGAGRYLGYGFCRPLESEQRR